MKKHVKIILVKIMKFEKFKEFGKTGLAAMICESLNDYIIVYGGSNIVNGIKEVYNDIYLYDKEFNLINRQSGSIYPNQGLCLKDENRLIYILNGNIYEITIENEKVLEKLLLETDIEASFAAIYQDKLYFGKTHMYEYDFFKKELVKKAKFISEPRDQCVYAINNGKIYILGGASEVCYLDSYSYDIKRDEFERLSDIPVSFTGSAFLKLDDKLLIIGGFNKEVYDDSVKKLKIDGFREKYFNFDKEYFNWNNKIYVYDFKNFEIISEDDNTSFCGASLIKQDDNLYIFCGEIKPGLRSRYIYKAKV